MATYSNLSSVAEAERLPHFVREAGLYWWSPDGNVAPSQIRIVFGVSTWCGYDMRVLDALEEASPFLKLHNVRIEVLDLDKTWHELKDLNRIVPGIAETQPFTPIVGVWRYGELAEKASGYYGRELIFDTLRSITGRDFRPYRSGVSENT